MQNFNSECPLILLPESTLNQALLSLNTVWRDFFPVVSYKKAYFYVQLLHSLCESPLEDWSTVLDVHDRPIILDILFFRILAPLNDLVQDRWSCIEDYQYPRLLWESLVSFIDKFSVVIEFDVRHPTSESSIASKSFFADELEECGKFRIKEMLLYS